MKKEIINWFGKDISSKIGTSQLCYTVILCQKCNGTGEDNQMLVRCFTCFGDGYLRKKI